MSKFRTVLLSLLLCSAFSVPAFSLDLGVGVSTYYSYWEPAFLKNYDNVKVDPAMLVGPSLLLHFYDKWSLGLQAMLSVNNFNSEYTVNVPAAGDVTVVSESRRFEGEISLMYALTSNFRIFGGYKKIDFDETGLDDIKLPAGYTTNIDVWENAFHIQGPGGGIAFSMPLTESINATLSTSLLYFNMFSQGYVLTSYGSEIGSMKDDQNYHGYGNNSALVFSYILPSISTAINLGLRCQYISYKPEGDAAELDSDLNYGVTLSAMYFF